MTYMEKHLKAIEEDKQQKDKNIAIQKEINVLLKTLFEKTDKISTGLNFSSFPKSALAPDILMKIKQLEEEIELMVQDTNSK